MYSDRILESTTESAAGDSAAMNSSAMDGGSAGSAAAYGTGTAADGGYSDTNVREEGVDEPDVVKTDGEKDVYKRQIILSFLSLLYLFCLIDLTYVPGGPYLLYLNSHGTLVPR